jgi:hypothetical protein
MDEMAELLENDSIFLFVLAPRVVFPSHKSIPLCDRLSSEDSKNFNLSTTRAVYLLRIRKSQDIMIHISNLPKNLLRWGERTSK